MRKTKIELKLIDLTQSKPIIHRILTTSLMLMISENLYIRSKDFSVNKKMSQNKRSQFIYLMILIMKTAMVKMMKMMKIIKIVKIVIRKMTEKVSRIIV